MAKPDLQPGEISIIYRPKNAYGQIKIGNKKDGITAQKKVFDLFLLFKDLGELEEPWFLKKMEELTEGIKHGRKPA